MGGINSREGTRGGEIIPTLIQLTGGRMPKIIEVSKPGECPRRFERGVEYTTFCLVKIDGKYGECPDPDTFPDICPLKEKEE